MGYIEDTLGDWATDSVKDEHSYNGWSSYETWLFSVHDDGSSFDDYTLESWNDIKNNADDYEDEEAAAKELLHRVSEYAKEMISDQLGIYEEKNLLKKDVLMGFVKSVNWLEIASGYIDAIPTADHPLWIKE